MRINTMNYYGITRDLRQAGFYETEYHQRLFQEMKAAIRSGGLVAVTGIIGSGKTTAISRLQDALIREGRIIVARSLSVEKQLVTLQTLIAALFYDLSKAKEIRIPTHGERRERELQELIRQARKPVALFVDDAHDLSHQTLRRLKQLLEVVHYGGGTLTVVLVGHPRLRNDLQRPTMEEIGYRTIHFTLDGAIYSRRQYIEWLLSECTDGAVTPRDILEEQAIDLLAERLVTPLQIQQHLTLAMEAGHDADEKPVSAALAESILSGALADWEAALARHGYDHKSLAQLLNTPLGEIRQLFRGELEPSRTQALQNGLMVVGLPVK